MRTTFLQRTGRTAATWRRHFPHALAGAGVVLGCLVTYYVLFCQRTTRLELPDIQIGNVDVPVGKAIEDATMKIRLAPDSADAWGKLGMMLIAHEMDSAAADFCYRRAAALNPKDVRWPYYRGVGLLKESPEHAVPELKRAAAIGGDAYDIVRLQLSEVLLQLGRLNEADEELESILTRDRINARVHLMRARIAFQRGTMEPSLAALEKAVLDPRTRKAAHSLRAQIYTRQGKKALAATELELMSRAPVDLPWSNPLEDELVALRVGKRRKLSEADELLAQNRPDDAAASLRKTLRDYPDLGWAWLLLGRASLVQKDFSGAEEALLAATRLLPDSAESQFYLGAAMLLQKNRAAAAAAFRRAAELEPTLAAAHFNLANCLIEDGDRQGAIEALRAALRCKPDLAEAHARLADLLVADGERAAAIEHLRTAVTLDPADLARKETLEKLREPSPQLRGKQ